MTRDEFNNQVNQDMHGLINKYAQEYEADERMRDVLNHIAADGPCGFAHIDSWVKYQLPDGIDTGEIVEVLINKGYIIFCHSSQSYEVA
jgi:hypothetical protein